jgi:nucleoid-associated protein YgaU
MGVFDFVRGIGNRLTGGGSSEAAADDPVADQKKAIAMTTELKKLGLPVEGLKVAFRSGTATLSGTVTSSAVEHKLIVALGNISDVGKVDSQIVVRPPATQATAAQAAPVVAAPPPIFHTVKAGESLSLIAKELYGAIHLYPAIFEANQPMITDVDQIFPGQVLTIPRDPKPLVHTVKSGETLSKIARYHYGDMMLYPTIFEANRGTLDDPDHVSVGQQLTIPLLRRPGSAVS